MNDFEDEEQVVTAWYKAFRAGTDHDLWGQPVEAIEDYKRLSKQFQKCSSSDISNFSDEQKKIVGKIAICLELRCRSLQNPGTCEGISLDDLKKIGATLQNLLKQKAKDFPVDVLAAQLNSRERNIAELPDYDNDEDRQPLRERGSLLPEPVSFGGRPVLTIRIVKIGLKDAKQYIDPYMSIYVKDSQGADLTSHQDTPVASVKEDSYVIFNVDVHIQKTLDSLPPGYAVFFEFKHYKPKKGSVSTRCWTVMESDEIKEGTAVLELYKKPANYRRKNVQLFTVKPLFLHLKLSINL
ncbi:AIDA-like protein [Mya arenaria]|uniref:AIDA-like protein n=1 Tax=Mya arenaria TaxID=6604 RepID=A0ABY7F9T5_MYAAR|nr:axin interactor, dorsalization-associated protein-like [Mya arenaria]XP_052770299.1 axin interactor, dorsalization-associated protein-like [Mya arenaria]WAR18933.1 AIDA-like protein [Mya arenaria]